MTPVMKLQNTSSLQTHICTHELCCLQLRQKQIKLTWVPFRATSGSFSAITFVVLLSPPPSTERLFKQLYPQADKSFGSRLTPAAVRTGLRESFWGWNRSCRSAAGTRASLPSFRVPLQSADLGGSTRTLLWANSRQPCVYNSAPSARIMCP